MKCNEMFRFGFGLPPLTIFSKASLGYNSLNAVLIMSIQTLGIEAEYDRMIRYLASICTIMGHKNDAVDPDQLIKNSWDILGHH